MPNSLTQVAEYYHETLEQSPEALEYLDSRGLNSPGLAARFKLGFANRTLGYRLPQKNRKDGQEIRTRLQEIGVIRESGHEHLNGSLVIPICDAAGNVVQLYGRKITPNLRSGTPRHLYLPGPRRGLFNLEALRQSKEIILCEALIDALTFIASGYENATAAYGTNGFTDELLQAMKSCGTERVLLAFDRDDAGGPGGGEAGDEARRRGDLVLPGAVSEGDGRQRVRAEGHAGGAIAGSAPEIRRPPRRPRRPLSEPSPPRDPMNHSAIKGPPALSSLAAASERPSPVKSQTDTWAPEGGFSEGFCARLFGEGRTFGPRGADPARRSPLAGAWPGPKPQLRDSEGEPPGRLRRTLSRRLSGSVLSQTARELPQAGRRRTPAQDRGS
jgi:DNA primase